MDIVRLATQEECQAFAERADLTPNARVVTYGGKDFGVLRQCWELDPVFYHATSNTRRRAEFINHVETILRFQGVGEYYFNVPATDETYLGCVKNWGATQTSLCPEYRLKKVL